MRLRRRDPNQLCPLGPYHTRGARPVQEECGICGDAVPYQLTAHVIVHPNTDEGVADYYVCRSCYDERVAPLFDDASAVDGPAASE